MKLVRSALVFTLLAVGALHGEVAGGVRVDIPFNRQLDLRSYDGPNIELAIRNREMGVVHFSIRDHENAVAVARTNINSVDVDRSGRATVWGTNHVEVQAPITQHSKAVDTGGFKVRNSSREAYLLYSHVSGLKVYWFDVLDTKQNECALLIVSAPRPAAESAILSAAEQINAIDKLESSGLLQPAEARAKRAAVIGSR